MGVLDRLKLHSFAKNLRKLQGNTIYFPGCATQKYLPDFAENYKTILNDLGVPVKTIKPFCCGKPLKEQGYAKEYAEHVQRTKEMLKNEKVDTIITNCASCMLTLREQGFEVKHTTEIIHQEKHKLQQFNSGDVTFQDNCVSARNLKITYQPREILDQTGFTVKEFTECKAGVRCCGGSCGLPNNAPNVAVKLSQRRLRDAPGNTIITDDPHCYLQLKKNTQNKEVLELSETLVEI